MSEIKPDDFKLGADPELFLRSTGPGKPFVSAHDLVPGTKAKPFTVPGGAVQHDGMAAEYNIAPATTAKGFVEANNQVLIALSEMLPEHELINKPLVTFGDKVWETTPEEAKELGCAPDLNAYTGTENDSPDAKVRFRTGSGHIHLGWTEDMDIEDFGHGEACRTIAKELDVYLGLPFVWLDNSKGAVKRRELYGKAGAYRIKPYGMEYRVLSNFWVGNEVLMEWLFKSAKMAFSKLLSGKSLAGDVDAKYYIDKAEGEELSYIPSLCKEYGIPLPSFK